MNGILGQFCSLWKMLLFGFWSYFWHSVGKFFLAMNSKSGPRVLFFKGVDSSPVEQTPRMETTGLGCTWAEPGARGRRHRHWPGTAAARGTSRAVPRCLSGKETDLEIHPYGCVAIGVEVGDKQLQGGSPSDKNPSETLIWKEKAIWQRCKYKGVGPRSRIPRFTTGTPRGWIVAIYKHCNNKIAQYKQ